MFEKMVGTGGIKTVFLFLSLLALVDAEGYILMLERTAHVNCDNETLEDLPMAREGYDARKIMNSVQIRNCPSPTETYVDIFRSHKVPLTETLDRMLIVVAEDVGFPPKEAFEGLKIKELEIRVGEHLKYIIYNSENENFTNIDTFEINCDGGKLDSVKVVWPARYREVKINDCLPSRTSYTSKLSSLGVDVSALQRLRVRLVYGSWREPLTINDTNFEGLKLKELEIVSAWTNPTYQNDIFKFVVKDYKLFDDKDLQHIDYLHVDCENYCPIIVFLRLPGQYKEVEMNCGKREMKYNTLLNTLGVNVTSIQRMSTNAGVDSVDLKWERYEGLAVKRLEISTPHVAWYNQVSGNAKYVINNFNASENADLSNVDELYIQCVYKELLDPHKVRRTVRAKTVKIFNCLSPINALNTAEVDNSTLQRLEVYGVSVLNTSHFEGVDASSLSVYGSDINSVYTSFNESKKTQLFPFPDDFQAENVVFSGGESMKEWGGCSKLQRLKLVRWKIPETETGYFSNCPLKELELNNLEDKTVQRALSGVKTLTSLTINNCQIHQTIRNLLEDSIHLRYLNLSNNDLEFLPLGTFEKLQQLEVLDISGNPFSNSSVILNSLASLKSLRRLVLDNCKFEDFCDNVWSLPLEHLSLKNTSLSRICFSSMNNLSTLDVSGNNIIRLEWDGLPTRAGLKLEVDLTGNPLQVFPDTKEQFEKVVAKFSEIKQVSIKVDNGPLDCDCKYFWFASTLQQLSRLRIPGLRCSSGEELTHAPLGRFRCEPIHFLYAENDTSILLDLPDSRITRESIEALQSIIVKPKQRVRIDDRRLHCSCRNLPLLRVLQANYRQVESYDKLRCNTGGLLRDVIVDTLCCTNEDFLTNQCNQALRKVLYQFFEAVQPFLSGQKFGE